MENLLGFVSMGAGIAAGTLMFVNARKNPEKTTQMRRLGAMFFGIAGLMAVVFVL